MENNFSKMSTDPGKPPAEFAATLKGLCYISETDAEILPYLGAKAEAVTRDEILRQTARRADEGEDLGCARLDRRAGA